MPSDVDNRAALSSINMELDKISGRKKGGMGRRLWEADKDLAKARVCRDQIRGYVGAATVRDVPVISEIGQANSWVARDSGGPWKDTDGTGKSLRRSWETFG